MLESCQETSKLSVDSFMGSYDRMVPQKSDFWKKIVEKVLNMCLTPPWFNSQLRDYITQFGKHEGYTNLRHFRRFFS